MDNELCLQVRLDGQAHSKLRCLSEEDGRSFEEILLDCFRERYVRNGPAAPLRSLRASYKPQTHRRQAPLVQSESALLFIDLQNYNCSRCGALYTAPGKEASSEEYWWREVAAAMPRWVRLRNECKRAGIEVVYTVIQSLTADGRDRSLDYKISGFHVPPGSYDAQVLDCIAPGGDDIVLPKTSASVFISTSLDYILRCLGKRQIVISGALTDQCVEGAVRDACDLNYLVTLVSDACVTMSCERHESSLRAIAGYCRQRTTDELVAELAAAAASAGC